MDKHKINTEIMLKEYLREISIKGKPGKVK